MRPPVDEEDQGSQTGTHFLGPLTSHVLHLKLPLFVWILHENALNLGEARQADGTRWFRVRGVGACRQIVGHGPQASCESIAIARGAS